MSLNAVEVLKAPYGIAFAIEDLLRVRQWAESRALRFIVVLDQMMDGAEFEEILVLAPPDRQKRTLTMWRTAGGIIAQTSHSRPRSFANVIQALGSIQPAQPKRSFWSTFLRARPAKANAHPTA